MRRLAALLVVVSLSLAICSPAVAQIGPLAPAAPPAPPPPPAPTTTTTTKATGLSTQQELLIFAAALALIGAIAWVIMRDAKRSAPVTQRAQSADRKPTSAREREREQRQRRNKAKAARRQRKRNRPR